MAAALGMPQPMGSIMSDGACRATRRPRPGVQVGDVILRYDNQTPSDERALLRDIAKSTVGQTVPMTVLRAGQEQTLQVTPVAWPDTRDHVGHRGRPAPSRRCWCRPISA